MGEMEVYIDTEEMASFIFRELIERGFVPSEDESNELADIFFEYLLLKCVIDEEMEDG
ncbi:YozD family protein [Bacillus fonticola]|uniref:YozD family protein n=1 Tax=Bacillus fonticola TaxID=2728853 RepID=UPI0014731FDF|nr:YozD family protein [Bacillus fonticola]